MALQSSDLLLVERANVQYHMTADELADFLGAVNDYSATTIAARDANTLTPTPPTGGLGVGDRVFVADATGDGTVDAGWAVYRVSSVGPIVYDKVQEQESLDVVISVALGYTASPTGGTVTNSAGADASLPVVDGTNAGLATPAMFTNSHVAASAGLTPGTNPVVVGAANQEVTFSISQLAALP